MTRNTLPVSVRHLHPGICKAFIRIERLSRRIGPLSFEASRRYGRIAKYPYLYIFDLGADILSRFRVRQKLGLVYDLSIAHGNHDFVSQQRDG